MFQRRREELMEHLALFHFEIEAEVMRWCLFKTETRDRTIERQ